MANPMLRYALVRIGIFAACAVLVVLLLPGLNLLVQLMLALLGSAAISLFALRGLRGEVAQQLQESSRRRAEQRERLRAALAGEDPVHAPGEKAAGDD